MRKLAAYFRKPKATKGHVVYPTGRGWVLSIPNSRQRDSIIVSCRGLLDKIIAKEEEIGVDVFREATGYSSSDFMEEVKPVKTETPKDEVKGESESKEETKETETPKEETSTPKKTTTRKKKVVKKDSDE